MTRLVWAGVLSCGLLTAPAAAQDQEPAQTATLGHCASLTAAAGSPNDAAAHELVLEQSYSHVSPETLNELATIEGWSSPGNVILLSHFQRELENRLKNSTNGYVIHIQPDSRSSAYQLTDGYAINPVFSIVASEERWTAGVRMHIASVSKFLTAVTLAQILQEKNISYDTPVGSYLPAYWTETQGGSGDPAGFGARVTFADLIWHRSGLRAQPNYNSSDTSYSAMFSAVQNWDDSNLGTELYQNLNYGLMRILISTTSGALNAGSYNATPQSQFELCEDSIQAYASNVHTRLFVPAGLGDSNLTMTPSHGDALGYGAAGQRLPGSPFGWSNGDLTYMAGAAGWYMNTGALMRIATKLRNGDYPHLDASTVDFLQDNGLISTFPFSNDGSTIMQGLWMAGGCPPTSTPAVNTVLLFLESGPTVIIYANSPNATLTTQGGCQWLASVAGNAYAAARAAAN